MPIRKNRSKIYKLFLLISLSICVMNVPQVYAEHLIASGCSISNVGYLSDLVKDYEKETGIRVSVRGGGSTVGLRDLKEGKVDFAASCRERTGDDPEDLEFIQVAWDALVFIVHKTNPINDISLNNLRAIYEGRITNWQQLKGFNTQIKSFIPRHPKGLAGTDFFLKKMILNGKDPAEAENVTFVASSAIVEQMTEKSPEGFGATGFSSARKRDVKMLKVNVIMPTKENIVSKKYPFHKPLFLVIQKKASPEVRRFIEFVLSKKGQRFISSYGAISLLDMK